MIINNINVNSFIFIYRKIIYISKVVEMLRILFIYLFEYKHKF